MTGTDILNIPSGVFCPRVRTRSASSSRVSGSLHRLKYSRPCPVRLTRRVVRLSSNTPSFDSSTDNRRLTVEIGMPNERAARLMLSNWATLTNIRTSSRFAIEPLCHFWKLESRVSHLISIGARPKNRIQQAGIQNEGPQIQPEAEDAYDYEAKDNRRDGSVTRNRCRSC